jgi:hypothetical protein
MAIAENPKNQIPADRGFSAKRWVVNESMANSLE